MARRGEKVVIRILDKTNLRSTVADLGLAARERELFERLLGHREGMVLVTGPTGSGKTTTLYAALNQLKTGKVNIVTVEDPVEYDVAGISQIQVSDAQGLTFAKALRSVLRQDPDIVLVGEIRDLETATTAVQAGFSGHFVLSTLHTNDAAVGRGPPAGHGRRLVQDRLGAQGRRRPAAGAPAVRRLRRRRSARTRCRPRCARPRAARAAPGSARPSAAGSATVGAIAAGCPYSRSCRWTRRCRA